MGNIMGYIKYSCSKCRKYGISNVVSSVQIEPPFRHFNIINEKLCPFCKNPIDKTSLTLTEVDPFGKGVVYLPDNLESVLIFDEDDF